MKITRHTITTVLQFELQFEFQTSHRTTEMCICLLWFTVRKAVWHRRTAKAVLARAMARTGNAHRRKAVLAVAVAPPVFQAGMAAGWLACKIQISKKNVATLIWSKN